ncbi:MAG: hypothetical protein RR576_12365 [Oscillospiraceae bacterium]
MNIKTIVNEKGIMTELAVAFNADASAIDYIIKNGEAAVQYLNDVLNNTNGINHPPLKPVWSFALNAWQEMATAAELEAAYPKAAPQPPSVNERLNAAESALLALMGGV